MKKVRETDLEVNIEEFRKFIMQVKESKSSSPSGRRYGHYKVLSQCDKLIQLVFDVMGLALKAGVVLERWEKVIQILLLKDSPEVKIHRFWNITLVEADLMSVMRFVWEKVVVRGFHRYWGHC